MYRINQEENKKRNHTWRKDLSSFLLFDKKNIAQSSVKVAFLAIIFLNLYEQDRCYGMWYNEMSDAMHFSVLNIREQNLCSDSTHGLSKAEYCAICTSHNRQKREKEVNKRPDINLIDEIKSEKDNFENIITEWLVMMVLPQSFSSHREYSF